MNIKFLIFLLIIFFTTIAIVSAEDSNSTDVVELSNESFQLAEIDVCDVGSDANNGVDESSFNKTTPEISIKSANVKSKDTLEFYFKNASGSPIESNLTVTLNGHQFLIKSNSEGIAKLKINLPSKNYKLTVLFEGDDKYHSISVNFNIKVNKLKTKFTESGNFVVKGKYIYFYLIDSNGDPVSRKKVTVKFKGKTYTKKTNSHGRISFKIKSSYKKFSIKVKFKGDAQYKASSKKLRGYVVKSRSIKIGNSKLLTNGYLRVYLKFNGKPLSKKVKLMIAGKKLIKKANGEGIAIFKPKVNANHYTVKAKVGKYYSSKNIKCYEGNVKDPLKENISYKNGKPDVDLMPGNYVMGDNNGKYTLTKSQYREVLKRDSYCLFLNNKLTKYTFFKTKSHPKLNHIIKREKWNVIEREINKKLVKANKISYWPGKITVSLKGKSYTYPYVRDVQNKDYTCGPTSCSVCSQVLKNYFSEKYLAKLSHSKPVIGTSYHQMIKALEKHNFACEYFYKSSFKTALNELKNGGAALVFHAYYHYVSILDISKNGKKVLVSNSYGSYDKIPTKWIKVSYMKKKFAKAKDGLIIKLNYKLSMKTKNSINCYYNSFGVKWLKHNTRQSIGRV